MTPIGPDATDVLVQHRRMVAALRLLGQHYDATTRDARGPFFGMCVKDFERSLGEMREALDQQVVLALAAGADATLKKDFLARTAPGRSVRRDGVTGLLRILEGKLGDKVALEAILDIWSEAASATEEVELYKRLVRRRRGLAPGRYWTGRSSLWPDPEGAARLIAGLFKRLGEHAADFPLR